MPEPTSVLDAVVDAAQRAVFDVLLDWRKNVLWEQELLVYVPRIDEPVRVGSWFRWERQIGRRRIGGESVVTALVPERLLVTKVPHGRPTTVPEPEVGRCASARWRTGGELVAEGWRGVEG